MIDPFSRTRYHPHLKLETWYPEGELDHRMAALMVSHVGFDERIIDGAFDRFTDFSRITSIRLNFIELSALAAERREAYQGEPPVKSAFLAISAPAYGIARMFAALMERSPIDVQVFRDPESVAHWLGIPVETLEAD